MIRFAAEGGVDTRGGVSAAHPSPDTTIVKPKKHKYIVPESPKQHNHAVEAVRNVSRSSTWRSVEMQLCGGGEHHVNLQSPGFRFRMPASVVNLSESLFREPWVASSWLKTQLRLVPLSLWNEYLTRITEGPNGFPSKLVELINTRAERISKKCPKGRWYIRQNLIDDTCLASDSSEIVIVVNHVWIEIWTPSARRKAIDEAMDTIDAISETREAQKNPKGTISSPCLPEDQKLKI